MDGLKEGTTVKLSISITTHLNFIAPFVPSSGTVTNVQHVLALLVFAPHPKHGTVEKTRDQSIPRQDPKRG